MVKKQGKPAAKFVLFGRGKLVHVIRTEAWDRKNAQCLVVRKNMVAGKIDYRKSKGLSPEAALALQGCTTCATELVATASLPPAAKREDRKDKRDDVLRRAKGESLTEKARKGRKTEPKQPATRIRAKGAVDKPVKAPSKTKAGMRSVGNDTDAKAKALAMFMTDNGWNTDILVDKDTGHTVVSGVNGDQSINAYFIDGKYDVARHATIHVGSWSGTLRGAHAVRRQVSTELDDRDRPHPEPGRGRSASRKKAAAAEEAEVPEDESPEDARRRVPFSLDAPDIEIIAAIKGMKIVWRNGVSGSVESAIVPSKVKGDGKKDKHSLITITDHPKTGRRILSFYSVEGMGEHGEVYGGERNIALDKIIRVAG